MYFIELKLDVWIQAGSLFLTHILFVYPTLPSKCFMLISKTQVRKISSCGSLSDPHTYVTCILLPRDHNEVYLTSSPTVVSLLATGVVVPQSNDNLCVSRPCVVSDPGAISTYLSAVLSIVRIQTVIRLCGPRLEDPGCASKPRCYRINMEDGA